MDMNFSRSGNGLFLLLLMMFCLDGLSFISGESASNPDLHYWDARRIENSILRKFHRHDYLKVESELNAQIQQLASAQGSVDAQEVFDTLLSLIECRLRLNGENLYGWLDLLVNHWNENESIRNEYNQAAFLAINFLVDQMSGQWEWGLAQIPLIQNNSRHGLQNLGASFQLLHQYHTGKGSTLVGEAIEFEGLTEMNSLPSLVTLYSIWNYAVFTHDLGLLSRCEAEFLSIKSECEKDPFWLGMFLSVKLEGTFLGELNLPSVRGDLKEFEALGNTQLGAFFCLPIEHAIQSLETWTLGGVQDLFKESSCSYHTKAKVWGFSRFWSKALEYDDVMPSAALIDWEACFNMINEGLHGPLQPISLLGYANCLARTGNPKQARELLSDFTLESIEMAPEELQAVAVMLLQVSVGLGLSEFDEKELQSTILRLTSAGASPAMKSMNEFYTSLTCLEDSNVDICVYDVLAGEHNLQIPHQIVLLTIAASYDVNAKRAIQQLELLKNNTANPGDQAAVLLALKSMYSNLGMQTEMSVILREWIDLCQRFFPSGSYPRMEVEYHVHSMPELSGYDEESFGYVVDFYNRLQSSGLEGTDLGLNTLGLLCRAAADAGLVDEEWKWRQMHMNRVVERFGADSPQYARAHCNRATSDYYSIEEAIDQTRDCIDLISNSSGNVSEMAWYTSNLATCYSNAGKPDSALVMLERANAMADSFIFDELDLLPLDGRNELLFDRADLMLDIYTASKKSGLDFNYDLRLKSLQAALPSLSCSLSEGLSQYRDARWLTIDALGLDRTARQSVVERFKMPRYCIDDSVDFRSYCQKIAADREGGLYQNTAIDFLTVQKLLDDRTAMIDVIPFVGDSSVHFDVVYLTLDERLKVEVLSTISQQSLNDLEEKWRGWMLRGKISELQLEVVSSSIFGPDFLIGEEIEDLLIFWGGPLSFLTPQNLLMANGEFLREKVRCIEVVGFEAVISGAVDSIVSPHKITAFGDFNYETVNDREYANLKDLPGSALELNQISTLCRNNGIDLKEVRRKGNRSHFGALKSPDILHVSMHGTFDYTSNEREISYSNPYAELENCALLLPNDSGIDAVSGTELACLDLSCTELTVLGACNSGSGSFGVLGQFDLARAFFISGSKAVLSSRWEVADSAASFFLGRFYAKVLNGSTMVEAFDAAISEVAMDYDYADWANWALQFK